MAAPLVVTPGMGIGPEVTLRAVARSGWDDLVLVGRRSALDAANRAVGLPLRAVDAPRPAGDAVAVLDPGDEDEPTEVAAIRLGALACLDGRAAALVTGPIHKMRLARQGFAFPGHTGFLGHLCGVDRPVMAFAGEKLRVALLTTHRPLASVPEAITGERVRHVVRVAVEALRRDLGLAAPRVALCGLNPHAGEEGLLGREELERMAPAAEALRAEGLDLRGPVSAETAFLSALRGEVDLVVAAYHDQGLVALKAVEFGRSVNWTLGLPIVRTSVDHGTADDLVGTGRADPSSMEAALGLARRIVARRAGG